MFKNKKAGEKYLSIWWIFVLIIITVAIVAGVSINRLKDVNTKAIEADILVNRVADCLIQQGYIKQEFLNENFDIFKECLIDKETITNSEKYYLNIAVYNYNSCKIEAEKLNCQNPEIKYEFGVLDFENQCGMEGTNYPKCSEKYIYTLNKSESKFILKIKAGSNKQGKQEV